MKRLLTKYENNPVMCPAMMPENVLYTFNPGAIEHNGETVMVMNVTTCCSTRLKRDGCKYCRKCHFH